MRKAVALFVVIPVLSTTLAADAAIITTADGGGSDYVLRRNNTGTQDSFLRIKNSNVAGAETDFTDRIGVLNFDTSLEPNPVTNVAVVVTTDLDGDNQFSPGETLYLYGVPNGAADENYTSLSFTDFDYSTGSNGATDPRPVTDLTPNSINDDTAILLDTIDFTSPTSAGVPLVFQSPTLTAFVQGDTTGVASFIIATSLTLDNAFTPVIASADNANQAAPTLLTNADAPPVPEPTGLVLLAVVGCGLVGCRSGK